MRFTKTILETISEREGRFLPSSQFDLLHPPVRSPSIFFIVQFERDSLANVLTNFFPILLKEIFGLNFLLAGNKSF